MDAPETDSSEALPRPAVKVAGARAPAAIPAAGSLAAQPEQVF
jgi:hypothetical protein